MGLDARDWEEDEGPSRTDTMILFTLDPATHSAGILSIPRDLWVNIPGFDYAKINTAYFLGEGYQVEGGGPGLAMQTVEEFLGIQIDYYAQVDFNAFVGFIDEIGGIDVNVPEAIEVDPIGPGNTVILDAGVQHLDGATTLAYARARNTPGGDIDRAERQQQVILAIRSQIMNLNMLPLLMQKSPILYSQLANGVHTNLTLEQLLSVAWAAGQVPRESIKHGQIGYDQATLTMSWDGQSILMPDPAAIYALRDEIFTPGSQPSPTEFIAPATAAPTANPYDNYEAEGASISVLNGTDVTGLAAATRDYLVGQGINVNGTGNADEIYELTTIIDYTGKIYTRQVLADLMNVQASQVYSSYDPNAEYDIVVVIGNDWAASNPMP
jgi:LCP family protein required for cell wall assembly